LYFAKLKAASAAFLMLFDICRCAINQARLCICHEQQNDQSNRLVARAFIGGLNHVLMQNTNRLSKWAVFLCLLIHLRFNRKAFGQ